jgi:Fe-S oxidoreductase
VHLIIYALVVCAALAVFAYNLYQRLRALRAARSYDARGKVLKRLGGVLLHVFGQGRLLHGDLGAGLMHAAIFWGFVLLLLNALHFIIGGFFPGREVHFIFLGRADVLGRTYLLLRDLFDVLVLLAVAYAAFRRLVLKPKRLKLSGEALGILGLIAALMVTDLLMSGAGMALGRLSPPYSPAESIIGDWFANASPVALTWLHGVCWWVHLLSFMYFLNLLPLSKHFHILTSVPRVYLRNLAPSGALPKIDFEQTEEFGVSRIEQLSWSNWLDAYSCTECGRCDHFCPAHQTGKVLSPQQIITGSREHIYGSLPRILRQLAGGGSNGSGGILPPANGRLETAPTAQQDMPLVGAVHLDTALWACTTCGACDTHCPLFIEHVNPIVEMRRHLVLEQEGRFPKELQATFRGLESQGNPWGIGAHRRLEWAEGLAVPTLADKPGAEWLYFVGCFASLDERSKPAARALIELLNHAGLSFAVLTAETCCGDPARRCGHEYLAQALIEQNAEQMRAMQPRKVFTACPHCYNTLQYEYAQFGVRFEEVVHHSELLMRLVSAGKLKPRDGASLGSIVYHDSCYLGRYNGIYSAPRAVLAGLPGAKLSEAGFSHDKGYCCGAGGGRMFMEETEGERVNKFRYGQLAATGAEQVATACPFCLTMLDDAAKDSAATATPVKDIAVLLREAVLG